MPVTVVVEGVTETCVSEETLPEPKVTVAFESALEMLPPVVGDTMVGGGERPLAVFAFGSGVVPVPLVAGVLPVVEVVAGVV
jgi:hypothetical protein